MKITVFGDCCHHCRTTYSAMQQAATEIDPTIEVKQIGDIVQILQNNVIQTPAIAINGKLISQGKHFDIEKAKELIKSNL